MELLPQRSTVGLGGGEAIFKPLDLLLGVVEALLRLQVCCGDNKELFSASSNVKEGLMV